MKKGSIILTGIFVILSILSVLALAAFAFPVAEWYVSWRGINPLLKTMIPVAYYLCTVPALVALICLGRLLHNIKKAYIFQNENSRLMGIVSICCIAVAIITAIATYWYLPFIFVTAAMLFIFLIVRIIRGCFIAAIGLREENDLTI